MVYRSLKENIIFKLLYLKCYQNDVNNVLFFVLSDPPGDEIYIIFSFITSVK